MTKTALFTTLLATIGLQIGSQVRAQVVERLANGDFETIALDDMEMPELDEFGHAAPIEWFRSVSNPAIPGVELTQLIAPINGDAADDSDGTGTNSIALNPVTNPPLIHSDWRSTTFEQAIGDELTFSFDFKFSGLSAPEFNEFRIDLRAFRDAEAIDFVTELQAYISPVAYREGAGGTPVPSDFAQDQWHTLTFNWVVPEDISNPAIETLFIDVRATINAFTTWGEGQLRLDNISVLGPAPDTGVTGDYNLNGVVDAADYTLWRDTFGQTVTNLGDGADGDMSGTIDDGDYIFWKQQFGTVVGGAGALAGGVVSVPEPGCSLLIAIAGATLVGAVRRRQS